MFNPIIYFKNCRKNGHTWKCEDTPNLIGDWINCVVCGMADEYVPGAHELKGYKPEYLK